MNNRPPKARRHTVKDVRHTADRPREAPDVTH